MERKIKVIFNKDFPAEVYHFEDNNTVEFILPNTYENWRIYIEINNLEFPCQLFVFSKNKLGKIPEPLIRPIKNISTAIILFLDDNINVSSIIFKSNHKGILNMLVKFKLFNTREEWISKFPISIEEKEDFFNLIQNP